MKKALFRFDVSPSIGAGHMSRSLALATELRQRGFHTLCCVNTDGLSMLPPAFASSAIACEPDAPTGTIAEHFALAVVDHYNLGAAAEKRLRAFCDRIVAIDDLADRRHCADVLIDSTPQQRPNRYQGLVVDEALCLLGADYSLLRSEFRSPRRDRLLDNTSTNSGTPRVLVSLGASDPMNATTFVLEALKGLTDVAQITVALSRHAPHVAEVRRHVAELDGRATLLCDVENMAYLIEQHDLAIGAPATSALERACLGLPQILLATAQNQHLVGNGLAEAGAAVFLGPFGSVGIKELAGAVKALTNDTSQVRRMADAGTALIDGRGAARVAALLCLQLRDSKCAPLSARRISADDAPILLAWQTHETTRLYSFDTRPPAPDAHARFVTERILSHSATTEILTRSGRPVAIVRADPRDGIQVVSIVVDPTARAQGVGSAALDYLAALLPDEVLVAHVDARNAASRALFEKAGYTNAGRKRLIIQDIVAARGRAT